MRLPPAVVEQQQRSQPVITEPMNQSKFSSLKPLAKVPAAPAPTPTAPASTPTAPASTPAPTPALKPNPPLTLNTGFGRSTSSQNRLQHGPTNRGGNNKKRTRKHKKHTSISASRRPTRRRRNPPTEGHKYTRKRPRT